MNQLAERRNAPVEFTFERYHPIAFAISDIHGCRTVTVQANAQQTIIAFSLDYCFADGV